jgi:hypothetical protein
MAETQGTQSTIESQYFEIALTIEEEQEQDAALVVEEFNLLGGIRAGFAIEMLPPESDPEVVANISAKQSIYTLRIPRGYTGLDGSQAELELDPVVFFDNQIL